MLVYGIKMRKTDIDSPRFGTDWELIGWKTIKFLGIGIGSEFILVGIALEDVGWKRGHVGGNPGPPRRGLR